MTETRAARVHNLFWEVKPDRPHVEKALLWQRIQMKTTDAKETKEKKTMFADKHLRCQSFLSFLDNNPNTLCRGAGEWQSCSFIKLIISGEARWCSHLHGGFAWQMCVWGYVTQMSACFTPSLFVCLHTLGYSDTLLCVNSTKVTHTHTYTHTSNTCERSSFSTFILKSSSTYISPFQFKI